jgi:polyhydroxyalkanoate synthesis regulator phasin
MTQLQIDILLVILKSQIQIENAVYGKLEDMQREYDTSFISDNMRITNTKIIEIRRQISVLESKTK